MFSYSIKPSVKERVRASNFEPLDLHRENIVECDLCGSPRQKVISLVDRYGFAERFLDGESALD